MRLVVLALENGITNVVLAGRMDIEGADSVDLQFSVIAGAKKKVLVDLSQVTLMSSLGLRTLAMSAKAIANKGGKMVIVGPQPSVEKILKSSGVDTLIPVVRDTQAASEIFLPREKNPLIWSRSDLP